MEDELCAAESLSHLCLQGVQLISVNRSNFDVEWLCIGAAAVRCERQWFWKRPVNTQRKDRVLCIIWRSFISGWVIKQRFRASCIWFRSLFSIVHTVDTLDFTSNFQPGISRAICEILSVYSRGENLSSDIVHVSSLYSLFLGFWLCLLVVKTQ